VRLSLVASSNVSRSQPSPRQRRIGEDQRYGPFARPGLQRSQQEAARFRHLGRPPGQGRGTSSRISAVRSARPRGAQASATYGISWSRSSAPGTSGRACSQRIQRREYRAAAKTWAFSVFPDLGRDQRRRLGRFGRRQG
jgi:hypothetical protein